MGPVHVADRVAGRRVRRFTMKTLASSSLTFLLRAAIPSLLYQHILHNAGL